MPLHIYLSHRHNNLLGLFEGGHGEDALLLGAVPRGHLVVDLTEDQLVGFQGPVGL